MFTLEELRENPHCSERTVQVPVRCPACQQYSFTSISSHVLLTALEKWSGIQLTSKCHDVTWDSSPGDFAGIRSFVKMYGFVWPGRDTSDAQVARQQAARRRHLPRSITNLRSRNFR